VEFDVRLMDNTMDFDKSHKYNEIKGIIKKRFLIKIIAYSLLLAAGALFTLFIFKMHGTGHYLFTKDADNIICIILIGFGVSGLIGSLQY
jgi:hypothetical protein